MGCYDWESESDKRYELIEKCNKLTDMLCRLCNAMEKIYGLKTPFLAGNDIQEWWEKHKEWDEKRK